jgi:hypothetical protein
VLVHREALERKLGRSIRPKMQALHHCDNPSCMEPEHLYEGTRSDNMRDMHARGRGRWGTYTLPETQRSEIRRRYAEGSMLQRELAAEYGVSNQTISDIVCEQVPGLPDASPLPRPDHRGAPPRQLFVEPGQRFGRLTVVQEVASSHPRKAECLCDCGNTTTQRLIDLFRESVLSCGCFGREVTAARHRRNRAARQAERISAQTA